MLELSGFDLRRAQLVPHAVFDSPDEVVSASFLSFAQKQAILRRWEFDARRMQGGVDAGTAPVLAAVRQALREVAAERAGGWRDGAGFGAAALPDPASLGDAGPRG